MTAMIKKGGSAMRAARRFKSSGPLTISQIELSKSRVEFQGGRTFSLLQSRTLLPTKKSDLAYIRKIIGILKKAVAIDGYVCAPLNEPLYTIALVEGETRKVFFFQDPVLDLPDGEQASVSADLRPLLDLLLKGATVQKIDLSEKFTITSRHQTRPS